MLAPGGRAAPTVLFAFVLTFLTNFYLIYNIYAANVAEVSIRKFINDSYVLQGHPAGIDPVTEKWFWSLCLNSVFLGQAIGSFATSPLSERLGRRCRWSCQITYELSLLLFKPQYLFNIKGHSSSETPAKSSQSLSKSLRLLAITRYCYLSAAAVGTCSQ